MSLAQWSTLAANNATGVTNVNWAEGQAPSTVNNSARQEMADVATWYRTDGEWIDRNDSASFSSGTIVTFTGINLTSIYNKDRRVRTVSSTPGTLHGTIIASSFSTNTTVTIAFDSTAVLSNEAITDIAVGIISNSSAERSTVFGIPTGVCVPFGSTAFEPTGFAFCNAQALNRTTEAPLFAVIGTSFGSSSTSTFQTPDLRGRAPFGLDNMGGSAAGVITSTAADTLGGTFGDEKETTTGSVSGSVSAHTLTVGEIPAPTFTILSRGPGNAGFVNGDIASAATSGSTGTIASTAITTNYTGGSHAHNDTLAFSGSSMAVLSPGIAMPWIIKK